MIEDFSHLENQLRALRPAAPSAGLENCLADALREPLPRSRGWWEWLGFHNPMAAFGWGIVVPTAAAAMAITLFHLAVVTPGPSDGNRSTARNTQSVNDRLAIASELRPAAVDGSGEIQDGNASSVLYETSDEGVVLTGQQQKPARRVRYRSEDTLQWRNPRTGASIEVSYPREEVVLTPITTR